MTDALILFSSTSTSLLLKFFPPDPSTHTFEKEFLNGLATLVGFSAAIAGGPAAGALGAALAGIAGGAIIGLPSTTTQLKDLASMQT